MRGIGWRLRALACIGAVAAGLVVPATAGAQPGPGTVVAVESLPGELSVPGAATAERLAFRTQWRSGASTTASGVLYLPPGQAPEGGWPVVSWAHGTVGVGDDCAPSRNPRTDRDRTYLGHWLSRGYAVVASDYPGLGSDGLHTYLDGPSAANSVVDVVRAARAAEPSLSNRWIVIGQSQGGHAALHTALLATSRAPELDFRGMIATGAPSNLETLFPFGGPGFPDLGLDGTTVFLSYVLAGLRVARPDVDVNSYLTPVGRDVVDDAERLCYAELSDRVDGIGVGEILARPLGDDRMRAALADYMGVPTRGYDRPLFLGQGLRDQVVPAPLSFKLVADLWSGGTNVDYRTYPNGHSETMFDALPATTPFAATLFGG